MPGVLKSIAMRLRAITLTICFSLAGTTVYSAEFTPGQKDEMLARIAAFDQAMSEGDYATVVGVVPPAVIAFIAKNAGTTVEELQTAMVEQTTAVMQSVKLRSFEMRSNEATFSETPDGTPYALIPTQSVIEVDADTVYRASSHTLAIIDEGSWYILRVEDPGQLKILREVYPSFAEVEFPKGSMEQVE